jgi:hypothetical protein
LDVGEAADDEAGISPLLAESGKGVGGGEAVAGNGNPLVEGARAAGGEAGGWLLLVMSLVGLDSGEPALIGDGKGLADGKGALGASGGLLLIAAGAADP